MIELQVLLVVCQSMVFVFQVLQLSCALSMQLFQHAQTDTPTIKSQHAYL